MNGAKPWQFVVLALGAAALVFVVIFSFSSDGRDVKLTQTVMVADVQAGTVFAADVSKMGIQIPMTNPYTNTATLYPAYRDGENWKIEGEYIQVVRALPDAQTTGMADKRAGLLKPFTEAPKPLAS